MKMIWVGPTEKQGVIKEQKMRYQPMSPQGRQTTILHLQQLKLSYPLSLEQTEKATEGPIASSHKSY